jgi:hypothetical protein
MEFAANGVRPYLIVALTGMLIEGELTGERFALSVDNPHACDGLGDLPPHRGTPAKRQLLIDPAIWAL